MVRDAYANYVVQTTLDVVPESEEKQRLLHELNLHADELVRLHVYENVYPVNPSLTLTHSFGFRKITHLQSTL